MNHLWWVLATQELPHPLLPSTTRTHPPHQVEESVSELSHTTKHVPEYSVSLSFPLNMHSCITSMGNYSLCNSRDYNYTHYLNAKMTQMGFSYSTLSLYSGQGRKRTRPQDDANGASDPKKPRRKRRSCCGKCIGCLEKEDCGICINCK